METEVSFTCSDCAPGPIFENYWACILTVLTLSNSQD